MSCEVTAQRRQLICHDVFQHSLQHSPSSHINCAALHCATMCCTVLQCTVVCCIVPRKIVPTSRRCRITATSSICHPTAPGRTASPAQLLWPTGFLCGWSVGLEFPAGQLAESIIGENSFRQSLKTFLFATY